LYYGVHKIYIIFFLCEDILKPLRKNSDVSFQGGGSELKKNIIPQAEKVKQLLKIT